MSQGIVTSLENSARQRYRAIIVNMECQRDAVGSGFSCCEGQKLSLCSMGNLRNVKIGQYTHNIVRPRETGNHLTFIFNTYHHITECPLPIRHQLLN